MMKGIYKKDLLLIASSRTVLLLVIVITCGLLIYFGGEIGMLAFFPIFMAMQATSTIFADRASGWYRMSTTLPLTRQRLVRSKYRLTALLAVCGLLVGIAVWAIVELIQHQAVDFGTEDIWINLYIGMIMAFCTTAILIPLAYLLKKSQEFLATVTSFLLPAAMVFYWTQQLTSEATMVNGDVIGFTLNMQQPLLQGMVLFSLGLFVLSCIWMPRQIARQDQR